MGKFYLLSTGGFIRRKLVRGVTLNRRACHHQRGTFCFVCWSCDTMSALVRQAPMIHVVQLVRPLWLCSGCCEVTGTSDRLSACSWSFDSASFREILASPERGGGCGWGTAELRSNFLAAQSASSSPSYLAFRAAAPARPAATFFGPFVLLFLVVFEIGSGAAGVVNLSTSFAICWFSIIVYCLRALMSKLTVLHCC